MVRPMDASSGSGRDVAQAKAAGQLIPGNTYWVSCTRQARIQALQA